MLPDVFCGLSTSEKEVLLSLPWKTSRINEIESLKSQTFFITAGRVYDQYENPLTINSELYGTLPFATTKEVSYNSEEEHFIKYIEVEALTNFLIQHPAAMKSYLGMMSHQGANILPHWQNLAQLVTVVSDEKNWEPIHFSLMCGHYHYHQSANKKKKSIYLEFQQDTLSIFNLVGANETLAITTVEQKESKHKDISTTHTSKPVDLKKVIKERIIEYSSAIDLLNIQYLSPYELTKEEWISLYWTLNENYDLIVAHCGTNRIPYLYEESRNIFFLTTKSNSGFEADFFQNNLTMWPLCKRILYKSKNQNSNLDIYPNVEMKTEDEILRPVMPGDEEIQKYSDWFTNNLHSLLFEKKWILFSNCFGDSHTLVNLMAYLSMSLQDVTRDQKPQSNIGKFLKDNICVFEGISSLWGQVASESVNIKQLTKIAKKVDHKFWETSMQPVFPKQGIYSQEPVAQLIEKIFRKNHLVSGNAFTTLADVQNENVFFSGMSNIENTLLQSLFPESIIETQKINKPNLKLEISSSKPMRSLFSGGSQYWINYLAYTFRLGLQQATIFELKPKLSQSKFLTKIMLKDKIIPTKNIAGKRVKIIPLELNFNKLGKNTLSIQKQLHEIFGKDNSATKDTSMDNIKDDTDKSKK